MYINPKIIFKDTTSDKNTTNFFCVLCSFPLASQEDFSTSCDWNGTCHECYLTFIECRRKDWKDGWRPDKETLEEYIYSRRKVLLDQEIK